MDKKQNENLAGARLPRLVEEAVALMELDYAYLAGVDDLAQRLAVSKCHLVRTFSAAMGQPPGQYLTMVRLEAAKLYLTGREYPVETIAGLTGFSGGNYFCKVFRKATGMSPGKYRAKYGAAASKREPPGERESFV